MKYLKLLLIIFFGFLLSCGQFGKLYLDAGAQDKKYQQLTDRQHQLAQELAHLRQIGDGNSQMAYDKYVAYKETEYELGQINLKRQQESIHGNF